MRALTHVAPLVLVLATLGGAGCRRPCETARNCQRTCECVDNVSDTRLDCTIAFRCEGAESVCESSFDTMSCDEMCSTYAARAQCGTERCASNADCVKTVTCPVLDANNEPVNPERVFTCTRSFECNLDLEICDAELTASDETHCAFCRATSGQGG